MLTFKSAKLIFTRISLYDVYAKKCVYGMCKRTTFIIVLQTSNLQNGIFFCHTQGYIDPRNPRHAIQEAKHLIDLSDANGDKRVSLPEMLGKMDLFLQSKVVNMDKSFHDEFR